MNYDIIIPVSIADSFFLKESIPYIVKNLGGDNIYIISNEKSRTVVERAIKSYENCSFIDEDKLVEGLTFDEVKKLLETKYPGMNMRAGWYFQQFLKLGFALSSYAKDYYLSWDADTIPLKQIDFFDGDHPLLAKKKEYNKPYFDTLERLLGYGKIADFSFIAEHMMFNVSVVKELLQQINSSPVEGDGWMAKIINATDYRSAKRPEMYSEFETYGTYCEKVHPGLNRYRQLNSFREGGMLRGRFPVKRMLDKMSFDIDTVSFEMGDTPAFPWSIVQKIYKRHIKFICKLFKADDLIRVHFYKHFNRLNFRYLGANLGGGGIIWLTKFTSL